MFFLRKSNLERLPVAMSGVRMGERALQIGIDDRSLAGAIAAKVGLSGHAALAVADEGKAAHARSAGETAGVLVDVQVTPFAPLPFDGRCVRRRRGARRRRVARRARPIRRVLRCCARRIACFAPAAASWSSRAVLVVSPRCCAHADGGSTRPPPWRRSAPPDSAPRARSPNAKATASPKASGKWGRGSFNEDTRERPHARCPRTNDPRPHFPARIRAKTQARLLPQCLSD